MYTPYSLKCYLKSAIDNAVAKCAKTKDFSRKSALSRDTVIRLLIGAEGGSYSLSQTSGQKHAERRA